MWYICIKCHRGYQEESQLIEHKVIQHEISRHNKSAIIFGQMDLLPTIRLKQCTVMGIKTPQSIARNFKVKSVRRKTRGNDFTKKIESFKSFAEVEVRDENYLWKNDIGSSIKICQVSTIQNKTRESQFDTEIKIEPALDSCTPEINLPHIDIEIKNEPALDSCTPEINLPHIAIEIKNERALDLCTPAISPSHLYTNDFNDICKDKDPLELPRKLQQIQTSVNPVTTAFEECFETAVKTLAGAMSTPEQAAGTDDNSVNVEDSQKTKRRRSSNFTPDEMKTLASVYKKHAVILERKFDNSITKFKKQQCWNSIVHAVNAVGGNNRTKVDLKTKYKNLKSSVKKMEAEYGQEIRRTGGKTADIKQLSEIQNEILQTLQATEISGIQDVDVEYLEVPKMVIPLDKGMDLSDENLSNLPNAKSLMLPSTNTSNTTTMTVDVLQTPTSSTTANTHTQSTPKVMSPKWHSKFHKSPTEILLQTQVSLMRDQVASFVRMERLLEERNMIEKEKLKYKKVSAILGKDLGGILEGSCTEVGPDLLMPDIYSKLSLSCRTHGHLSAVYCVLFDVSGKFIFTGADDKLVKVWSATDGRLLATLRGSHTDSAEITDLAVNYENTLLAASSCDKVIRIWCLQTGALTSVLTGHGGTVTSIFFCPIPKSLTSIRYLASTSTDGSCAFWAYTDEPGSEPVFQAKPTLYQERMRPGHAQMKCASFSSGGVFMAAGSADFNVRVYYMLGLEGPERVLEVEIHTDRVDSISWSHRGVRFISGSKDGTAIVWWCDHQQWRYIKIMCSKPCHGDAPVVANSKKRPRITMVGWNADDTLVLTAISNNLIKVWDPLNGNIVRILRDHRNESYVIETHPTNSRIVCTAGHDGNLFIWDIGTVSDPDQESGIKLFEYHNALPNGQGHGAIFDVKWSPDALCLAATDSHGNLLIFNCGDNSKFYGLPKELFFHTDYRPLTIDTMTQEVLDEETKVAPHLMPPPFLVDVDCKPYSPKLQKLVPGRENCQEEQLIPSITLTPTGFQEAMEGVPVFPGILNPRSNIDQMIVQLDKTQSVHRENGNDARRLDGNLRSGDIEGVRQSKGNWQTTEFYRYFKRDIVPQLSPSLLARSEEIRHAFAKEEGQWYQDYKTRKAPASGGRLGLPVSPTATISSLEPADERRQEKLSQIDERGVVKPKPPQQKISLPQKRSMNQRRPPRARQMAMTGRQGKRRARYTVPRKNATIQENEAENAHSMGESDSDFLSSDVSGTSSSDVSEILSSEFSSFDVSGTSNSDSESSESDLGVTPTGTSKNRAGISTGNNPFRHGKNVVVEVVDLEKIEKVYMPSKWLSEVIPKKFPYYPQLGDDLVYFRQGHEMYVKEIHSLGIYEMSKKEIKNLPWKINPNLPSEVPVRVIGIKFEIKPRRLVSLKLAHTDWRTGELTGVNINNVTYHDIVNVADFFVLRQLYNKSILHEWNVNDHFRCLIDKEWWLGTIHSKIPCNPKFPDSKFMCYKVLWDNNDEERKSPWDIDIITEDFEITKDYRGDSRIPASDTDLRSMIYEANERDWPPYGHRDVECIRIQSILENVMELPIAEPFLKPVDLNSYPMYAYEVEYPIDLSTIKSRVENFFYRRLDAVKFDVKYLAQNAEKVNPPCSDIIKQARIVRDICLRVMSQTGVIEVTSVYDTLLKSFTWSNFDEASSEKIARKKSMLPGLTNSINSGM